MSTPFIPDYYGNPEIQDLLATVRPADRLDAEEFLNNWETQSFFGPISAEDRAIELQALRSWIKNPEED